MHQNKASDEMFCGVLFPGAAAEGILHQFLSQASAQLMLHGM